MILTESVIKSGTHFIENHRMQKTVTIKFNRDTDRCGALGRTSPKLQQHRAYPNLSKTFWDATFLGQKHKIKKWLLVADKQGRDSQILYIFLKRIQITFF
jgi:hypothetical protein